MSDDEDKGNGPEEETTAAPEAQSEAPQEVTQDEVRPSPATDEIDDSLDATQLLESLKARFDSAIKESSAIDFSTVGMDQIQHMGTDMLSKVMGVITNTLQTAVETARVQAPELADQVEAFAKLATEKSAESLTPQAVEERETPGEEPSEDAPEPSDSDAQTTEEHQEGAQVINLAAVRAQREVEHQEQNEGMDVGLAHDISLPDFNIGETLRTAFQDYVNANIAGDEDDVHVNVDQNFLRDHAPGLLASILKSMAQAIIPETRIGFNSTDDDPISLSPVSLVPDAPTTEDTDSQSADAPVADSVEPEGPDSEGLDSDAPIASEDEAEEEAGENEARVDEETPEDVPPEDDSPQISVNIDLGNLLTGLIGSLFAPKKPPPPSEGES